jgi:hypothetical protein
VREGQASVLFEAALGSLRSDSREPVETPDQELGERVRVAGELAALDLAGESRVRESLRECLTQAMKERRARLVAPAPRRPWLMRRPVLAAEIAVLVAVALLAVVAPRSLAALVEPVMRMLERVRVGDHTEIVQQVPMTAAEEAALVEQLRQRLANGQSWSLRTPYGGFGGSVAPGESARVQRVSSLERLRSLAPMRLQVPTCLHRHEPVRFDHACVAPGGWVLVFFGSGPNELLLQQFPVGEGRSVSFARSVSRTTPGGELVTESPELKTEEMSLGGQTVVWDPDPDPPARGPADTSAGAGWRAKARSLFQPARSETSALRWEKGSVSYALMGRSLTREEAVDLFLSLRPLDELP